MSYCLKMSYANLEWSRHMSKVRKHGKETTDFECEVKHETDKAWLMLINDEEYWIPKSVSEYDEETGKITVDTWWAKKNELE